MFFGDLKIKKVFEFAKEDLTEMAKSNQPFCMELVTIDTHTPDGYICDECKHEYDSQYANVISCQSRQVEAFVRWCQKQEWYENTTIVITGDHKSMSEKFFKHLDKTIYVLLIIVLLIVQLNLFNLKTENLLSLIFIQQFLRV